MAAVQLGDDQKVTLNAVEADDAGNTVAAPANPLTWTVSDPALAAIDVTDPNNPVLSAVGPTGAFTVTVTDGTLTGTQDYEVVTTAATTLAINTGTPAHK